MRVSGFKQAARILMRQSTELAFLIGNGINRLAGASGGLSWDQLMANLIAGAAANSADPQAAERRLKRLIKRGKDGQTPASLPEVFDIIDAMRRSPSDSQRPSSPKSTLQREIVQMLKGMKPGAPHKALVNWANRNNVPVLTTNYDHCLQEALVLVGCKRRCFGSDCPKSDVYPWDRYYASETIADPASEFAVWHIHGDRDMERSIRIGLDQYMGMVERLRGVKFAIAKEILRVSPNSRTTPPAYHEAPWLRIFMGNRLWIQGLALSPAEVSLRWLLIQRFRYWRRFKPEHRFASGCYIHGPVEQIGPLDYERRIFLQSVGLKVITINKRKNMYVNLFTPSESDNRDAI